MLLAEPEIERTNQHACGEGGGNLNYICKQTGSYCKLGSNSNQSVDAPIALLEFSELDHIFSLKKCECNVPQVMPLPSREGLALSPTCVIKSDWPLLNVIYRRFSQPPSSSERRLFLPKCFLLSFLNRPVKYSLLICKTSHLLYQDDMCNVNTERF